MVLVSAAAFGTMAVIADGAQREGLNVVTLLFLRFALAAVVLWGAMLIRRESVPRGRPLLLGIAMGGVLYLAQSYSFFSALREIPAALASLLLYLYPVLVTIFSAMFFGERMTPGKTGALALALLGTVLTIGPVGSGNLTGILFGVASAVGYAAYILVGTKVAQDVAPLPSTAIVMGSTAVSYAVIGGLQGFSPITPAGFGWAAALAAVSVIAVGGFLAGLEEVGPVEASILSALEPIVTAILAAAFLSQKLTTVQLAGGGLILAAVVLLVRAGARSRAAAASD
jgi:drug/metabolite transporter (DMT)-like permease